MRNPLAHPFFFLVILLYGESAYSVPESYTLNRKTDILIYVYRGGLFESLGHNHTVRAKELEGFIQLDNQDAKALLYLKISADELEVDNPEDREQAGKLFNDTLDAEAVRKTKANMLSEKVLSAEQFPNIIITGHADQGSPETADVKITIRNRTHSYTVPIIAQVSENEIIIKGGIRIKQTDFGIEPISLLGGVLTVEDTISIRFNINASR